MPLWFNNHGIKLLTSDWLDVSAGTLTSADGVNILDMLCVYILMVTVHVSFFMRTYKYIIVLINPP